MYIVHCAFISFIVLTLTGLGIVVQTLLIDLPTVHFSGSNVIIIILLLELYLTMTSYIILVQAQ